jgi:hypothetical protein
MSAETTRVVFDPDETETETAPAPVAPEADGEPLVAQRPAVAAGSLLGQLQAETAELKGSDTKVLRIGKHPTLHARYRVLLDDEQDELEAAAKHAAELRRRVTRDGGSDTDAKNQQAALLLVKACVDVGVYDAEGNYRPLHEALAEDDQMGEDAPTSPLRFNRDLAEILLPDLRGENGKPPSSVDVCMALHRWGDSHQPMRTASQMLGSWMSAIDVRALQETLEGR